MCTYYVGQRLRVHGEEDLEEHASKVSLGR